MQAKQPTQMSKNPSKTPDDLTPPLQLHDEKNSAESRQEFDSISKSAPSDTEPGNLLSSGHPYITSERLKQIRDHLNKNREWFTKFGMLDKSNEKELSDSGLLVPFCYEMLEMLDMILSGSNYKL